MRKIMVAIGSRANYASLKSAMAAISRSPFLELSVFAYSTALLDRFGHVARQIEQDGFELRYKAFTHIEGETPTTMALSAAAALTASVGALEADRPDYLLVVGDRYEVLPVAMAASYMNIRVAHTMGGEVTGTIDESIRHALTKLAHLHFPATKLSRERIIHLGENPEHVHLVGCPRIDLAAEAESLANLNDIPLPGVGAAVDLAEPFLLVSQHPVTTEYESARDQMRTTLEAVSRIGMQTLVLWPNSDAGSSSVSASMRAWREANLHSPLRFIKNLPAEHYMALMSKTAVLIGNSSSALREGSFLGTPSVNVGTRQSSREKANNVIDSEPEVADIEAAVNKALQRGRLEKDFTYGKGNSGQHIAETLAHHEFPPIQKSLHTI